MMRENRHARPTFHTWRPGPSALSQIAIYVIAYFGMLFTAPTPFRKDA